MLEWIFPHNVFEHEAITPLLKSYGSAGNIDAMLINIIHTRPQPSLVVGGKPQVELLFPGRIPRSMDVNIHPDILIPVSVGMTYYGKNIISGNRIGDLKIYCRTEGTAPLMPREGHIFFKNVDGIASYDQYATANRK